MSTPVITADKLVKRYGKQTVVHGISFTVEPGEVFGLLGPNGAGKTTTILMLLGLTEISQGQVQVLGEDPQRNPLAVKQQLGYMPDSVGFYDELSGRDNLRYTAKLLGISSHERDDRISQALTRVALSDQAEKRVRTYSHGMRRRLGLAEIIMKQARVAILDEPTSGLDPQSTESFLLLIEELKSDGVSILLSSHLLDQMQRICDRVALFSNGRIVLMGQVEALAQQVLGDSHEVSLNAQGPDITHALSAVPGVSQVLSPAPGRYLLRANQDVRADAARRTVEMGAQLTGLAVETPSLDSIYRRYFSTGDAS